MYMERMIVGVEAMYMYAEGFVRALERGRLATVVSLHGDLGAGKTTFVQGSARALGVKESVTSPTFVIQKIYPLQGQVFERLIHIDAYRLKDSHELEILNWSETLRDPANIIFIEWPERVEGAIPKYATLLKLRFVDDQTRGVEVMDGA